MDWITNIKVAILKSISEFKFRRQEVSIKREIRPGKISNKILKNGKILILTPHSDDESVGCAKLISDRAEDIVCMNMDMAGGDSTELHKARYEEMIKTSKIYRFEIETISGTQGEKIAKLRKMIKSISPKYIALPFFYDWHSEHIDVMRLLKESMQDCQGIDVTILMYQVSVPIPLNYVSAYSPMTRAEQRRKWKIFLNTYVKQVSIPWCRFQSNERINGKLCGCYAAEAYSVEDIQDWINKLDDRVFNENERKEVQSTIQSLSAIRITVQKLRTDSKYS